VLLAEDNPANQRFARLVLEQAGIAVDVAGTGREAVAAVQRSHYDLVLMDWRMPEMDGLAATTLIRREPPPVGHVPIVALTANTVLDAPEVCLAAGMDAVLLKPVRPRELLAAVTPWLGPRSMPAATASTGSGAASMASAPESAQGLPRVVEGGRGGTAALDASVVRELVAFSPDGGLFTDMAGAFDEVVPRERAALGRAIDAGTPAPLLHAAHAIKGVAGQVGAREVQGLAAGIEELARAGTVTGAGALAALLDGAIARAAAELAAARPRAGAVA
jgi:CheY-like chemotaxis protein/HPt (histidine-containing phosphotransfer) domain-containing protein